MNPLCMYLFCNRLGLRTEWSSPRRGTARHCVESAHRQAIPSHGPRLQEMRIFVPVQECHVSVTEDQNNGGCLCFSMRFWLPQHSTPVQETSIPTNPVKGCHLMQESSTGGFSKTPEPPEFDSKFPALAPAAPSERANSSAAQPRLPAASAQECAMYEEWIKLSAKSSSIGARSLSTGEFQRWSNLKQVFGNSSPPNCR